jgi:hypothetical protein
VVPSGDYTDGIVRREPNVNRSLVPASDAQRRERQRVVFFISSRTLIDAFLPYTFHVLVDPCAIGKTRDPGLAEIHERLVRSHHNRGGGPQRVIQVERDDLD